MKIEKRQPEEMPEFIHKITVEYINDREENAHAHVYTEHELTAQYIDMTFRAGYEMAKQLYKKD